ncbi:MAG TPA: excinuclease ABC subunit UvrA [Flavobacteriales bacterium]|nr:excinuclease ABC subunit UvrA [Flavobacteriales bacterium]HRJ39310.1 excinuclease ABC subunit UvrA [Flavobacteriales bacterium]
MSKQSIEEESISVYGARVHNLKNVDISIPRNKLVVFTGLSGSGKSSLAFDTIYAEGQRRYIETFSSYARSFLGNLERPDVDKITGLSPVISIEQKTVSKNPRSTVGTITEVYDFLRLLFARAGEAYSYVTGEKMVKYSDSQIQELILTDFNKKKIAILAPVVKGRKGHYRELFEQIKKMGFLRVRVDGKIKELTERISLDRYKIHDVEIVVDRIEVKADNEQRISESIKTAMKHGKGSLMILDMEDDSTRYFSRSLMCPTSGISYPEPAPNLFSFNSPYGACPKCDGIGEVTEADLSKIIPDPSKSIKQGAIAPLGEFKNALILRQIEGLLAHHKLKITTPVDEIPESVISKVLYGTDEIFKLPNATGITEQVSNYEGVVTFVLRHSQENPSKTIQRWASGFMNQVKCKECNGSRLKKESLYFRIAGKNIHELASLDLYQLKDLFDSIEKKLSARQLKIATEILKEIRSRIGFLLDVGLNYLTLDRSARSLSGGEAQRIRLATQIGSELVGVLYILDEPSIGLHQRDNTRLIQSLKKLRDIGNSVIVVEHDKEMIMESDFVVDIGPGAGINGGKIVEATEPSRLKKGDSITTAYLTGKKGIPVPKNRRPYSGKNLLLKQASGHNLKNVTIELPLQQLVCITGVSGSGKSSLINETLYPILSRHFYNSVQTPLPYKKIEGLEHIDKVIEIDQSPIGRTPRSNPATYTNMFNDIRNLFAMLPEAKVRGYSPGRFSFNVKGGRCETCQGGGLRTIEMNFLPDVYVECETCGGKRYNKETLEVRFKGKSISDVLNMTISNAVEFFEGIPAIRQKLVTMESVGLGYLTLGQPSTTLSGGEAQRIKLSTELSKRETGRTLYILDEPTTGLHFEDIRLLLDVLNRLVDNGNSVLVIEHNLDIIKVADHVIDMGPEGGSGGGEIIAMGTPEQVALVKGSHTGKYLKAELKG